ncbi:hypothetical protein NBH00_07385 [Paraconexibacter antarcticus]|uniref:Uncharacterized protein n=1 Tax=Paraconexibacter antarcticus TaxID=2949664 RepID=A0ABY5DZN4_9ACTN|nr:hypothetical protein [Paraconexibacter antarcticus]UTI66024.1 hypothetical protein NBH00_07385 [Paraconexibacter antarcticus]
MLELLRPKPFRGDQVAAGTVVLTVLVLLLELRFRGDWGDGVHLLYAAAAAALVLGMAAAAPAEEGGPPAWHSTLYVTGFLLAGAALVNLAQVLGSHGGAGTVVWVGAALTALGAWMSRDRDSASGTLLGAIAGVVTSLALLRFVFSPDGVTPFRYLLLADAVALGLMALWQRIRGPAHGVQLLNAAGLVLLAIAATFAVDLVFGLFTSRLLGGEGGGTFHPATGWTLVVLAGGIGILSAGAADDERGNVVVGSALLLAFVLLASRGDLRWWPLLLAGATAALLTVGLRPSTPVPDEPPPGAGRPPGGGPAPLPPVRPVD